MKKIISILLFATVALHAQSNTENYIQTRVYLEPTTTESASAKKMESVQYFDGLGRPKQEIAVKGSPSGKDVVSYLEYDVTGRQTKNYLPVPQSGTQNGAIYASPLGNASASYGSEKIYSESILDNSPLNRVLKQTDVGTQWNTKPVQLGYDTNKISEVYQYLISTTWENGITKNILSLSPTETYPPGQLYKSTVKNEDEVETVEFKNKKGQTILVRKIMSSTLHVDTYYAYNEYGQLVYVLPPEAIHKSITDTLLNDLCYQYRYDRWSRLVEKKIPGKGWEYMVYDKQDRLVATQDSNLKEKGQWLYTTYDKFGRVAFTGIATGGDRNTEQGLADGISGNNVKRSGSAVFNRQGMDVFYDPAISYPHASKWITLLSVNYYDTYPAYSFNPPFPSSIQGEPVLKEVAYEGKSTKGLPVMSFMKNIEDDNWTKNYIYYDQKGRTVGSYSINHLGGYTKTESLLDFAGVTKQSKAYHKRLAEDPEKVITQTFTYDHQNRLLVHKHQVDTNPEEILVQNEYNELSQVKNRKLGGTNPAQPLQNIDYTYNIRGWLTKINDPSNLNGKLFGYAMKYTNPVNPNVAPGKFSGMITEIDWKNASEDVLKRYNYAYDALGRLKDAVYSEPNATVPFNNNYNEYVTYDLNGNIKTLKRNAFPASGGTTSAQVDDLIYNYTGNRLTKVTENALNDTGYEGGNNIISYDLNGNMKDMLDKGIQSIQYNYLDLSNDYTVQQSGGFGQILNSTMSYLYRADGTKLRKTYSSAPPRGSVTTRITDYLDGFQYSYTEGGGICLVCRTESAYEQQAYKNASLILPGTLTPQWKLDFVSTAAGYYSFTENRYIYQYRDHLGNARVTFVQNSAGVPEIIDTNNYYPFGLNHISNSFSTSNFGSFYSYKYNGKELQETGLFDYGWRQYMPDLGRWNGIDQLAESYQMASPYAYVLNNPISFLDPDGRDVKPTSGGYEFSGSDLQNVMTYLQQNGSPRKLMSALSAWEEGNSGGGDFWGYFGSWNAFGATGGDVAGSLYASTWGDGAMGATVYDIQEIVFTRTKITDVHSKWFEQQQLEASFRKPGHAQMIGGAGDFLGIFDIGGQVMSTWKPENRYLAMGTGLLAAITLRKPGLATKEATGTYYSVAFEMKLAEGSYPGVYRGGHFREANKALEAMMKTDTKFASSIDELGIVIPKSPAGSILGKSPKNWVWHHHVDDGIMQLVPKPQHTVGSSFWKTMHPGNKGGFSIWGK